MSRTVYDRGAMHVGARRALRKVSPCVGAVRDAYTPRESISQRAPRLDAPSDLGGVWD